MLWAILIIILFLLFLGYKKNKNKDTTREPTISNQPPTERNSASPPQISAPQTASDGTSYAIFGKIVELKVGYTGDTKAGVVIDESNPGVVVIGLTKNGKQKQPIGWKIDEPRVLQNDLTSVVTIRYKELSAQLAVPCSTSSITEIFAEYKGSLREGTTIDTDQNAVSVFAKYKNGDIKEITKACHFKPSFITLKKDDRKNIRITYDDFSCSLELICADKTTPSADAPAGSGMKDASTTQHAGLDAVKYDWTKWKTKVTGFLSDPGSFPLKKLILYIAAAAIGIVVLALSLYFLRWLWAISLGVSGILSVVYAVRSHKGKRLIGASVAAAAVMLLCAVIIAPIGPAMEQPNDKMSAFVGVERETTTLAPATTLPERTTVAETTTKKAVPTTVPTTAAPTTTEPTTAEPTTVPTTAPPTTEVSTTEVPTTRPPTTQPPTTEPPATQPPATEPPTQAPTAAPAPVQTEPPKEAPTAPPTEQPHGETYEYIGNANTGKFHYPYCSSVSRMKASNKRFYTCTRDEMIAKGYEPCQRCNP